MIKKYYQENNNIPLEKIIKTKCSEKGCVLKGQLKDYIILDGDVIKNELFPQSKSSDCIIISRNTYDGNKIDIIVCELGGKKYWKDVKDKLTESSQHFLEVIEDSNFEIGKFICCFLGKYKNHNRIKKQKRANIHIPGFPRHNVKIHNFNSGYDFKNLIK